MIVPELCVVDTNVVTTANGLNPAAGIDCIAASARALESVINDAQVCIDDCRLIISEYQPYLHAKGEPRAGHKFLKWIFTNEFNEERVTRVAITAKDADAEDFDELPEPDAGTKYDRSDRKFLAVAAAHPDNPIILQSYDSKWWGWQESLAKCGVTIRFLCVDKIKAKHAQKMGG